MSWKTFRFFDYEEVKDPETSDPFNKLKDIGITCCSCGRGMMVFGDIEGGLHILSSLSDMFSFKAYGKRVQHLCQLKTRNIVITVGDDEDFTPLIRVWNLDKRDKSGNPSMARNIKASVREGGSLGVHVMTIAAHENMNLIAVGYKDGTVLLIKGNITRDRASRQRIIHKEEEPGVYVTGMAFRQLGSSAVLMVATSVAVHSFILTENIKQLQVCSVGCELNCSTITDHTQDHKFVIGRPELVQFFTTESPAQCFGFEGEKSLLRWYRGYLITASVGSRGGGRSLATGGGSPETRTLTVYDIQNQLVAYQTTFPTRIIDVLSEWGSLYVLLKDGRLIRLDELDTKTKLETLFKKNLYHIAISLAKSQSYSDGLVEIFKEYGDHLYSKGDFDGAIEQYKLTIGSLEPSYVIRRFLDAQRIHNLTDYLKVLHEKNQANADHTTLLLNCYTKLKNEEELDKFVREEQAKFDVEAAIKVCRQATFFEHALTLAERFSEHDWYLLILLEDLHRHEQALSYISKLPFEIAKTSLLKNGRALVKVLPSQTTDLLILLCTDWPVSMETSQQNSTTQNNVFAVPGELSRAKPGQFVSIFVDKREYLTLFLEKMTKCQDCWSEPVCNTLLELYMTSPEGGDSHVVNEEKTLELLQNPQAKYDKDHALMLAQSCDFRIGILYLYEKAERYQQILDYHKEHNNVEMVMDTCRRFNHQEPTLWVQALSFFASRDDCRDKIPLVLNHIEEKNLLQPLMVVKLLAENKCATLSDVKPYIVRHLEKQNEAISRDEKQIKEYRESTSRMREQINELQSKAKVFQVMKCSQCKRSLTLPAVHFLCMHSFHQNCMEDEYENDCPICARENRKVLDIIHRQEQSENLHEDFHSQLQRSSDGFSVVAEYFGRGVFGKVSGSAVKSA